MMGIVMQVMVIMVDDYGDGVICASCFLSLDVSLDLSLDLPLPFPLTGWSPPLVGGGERRREQK